MILCFGLLLTVFWKTCYIILHFTYVEQWQRLRFGFSLVPFLNRRIRLIRGKCLFFFQFILGPRIYIFIQFLSEVLIGFLCLAFKSLEIGIPYINIVTAVVTGHVLSIFGCVCLQTRDRTVLDWPFCNCRKGQIQNSGGSTCISLDSENYNPKGISRFFHLWAHGLSFPFQFLQITTMH